MTIRPLYDRVVVKRVEDIEAAMQSGLFIPDSAKEKPQEGQVVAIAKGKRMESGRLVALDVQVGDRVLFSKNSGSDIELDGEEYLIMREDEILGISNRTACDQDESELIVWQSKSSMRTAPGRPSLMLTTRAMIFEVPGKKSPPGAANRNGGGRAY